MKGRKKERVYVALKEKTKRGNYEKYSDDLINR